MAGGRGPFHFGLARGHGFLGGEDGRFHAGHFLLFAKLSFFFLKDEVGRMKDESEVSWIHPSSFRLHPWSKP